MYRVSLDNFEGPLDLLLFFIKRDEIDIYDIPIAYITEEFLGYIRFMEELDIDVAGEFILMASTLMAIKAKLLIPQAAEADADDMLEEDPRLQLTRQLLEYKRFKEAAKKMRDLEAQAVKVYRRGMDDEELLDNADPAKEALQELTIFQLMETFKELMEKAKANPPVHKVQKRVTTIARQTAFVKQYLKEKGRSSFKILLQQIEDKLVLVTTFLAILDMAKEGTLWIYTSEDDAAEFEIDLRIQGSESGS